MLSFFAKVLKNKEVYWSASSNFIKLLCQWGILSILTKTLDLQLVGIYTYALAIAAPVFMFFGMQLRNVQVVDVKNEYSFKDYLYTRLFCVLGGILLTTLISLVIFHTRVELCIFFAVVMLKGQEQFVDMIYGYYQKRYRVDYMGKSIVMRSLLEVGIFLLLFWDPRLLWICFIASNIMYYCVYRFYDRHIMCNHFNEPIKLPQLKQIPEIMRQAVIPLTKKTYMLSTAVLLSSLTTNVPKYFIRYLIGYSFMGIYSGISYLGTAFFVSLQPMQILLRPRMANSYENNPKHFHTLKKYGYMVYTMFAVMGIVGIIFLGPWVLKMFFTEEFSRYNILFLYLFIFSWLSGMSSICSLSLQAKQIFNKQVYVSLSGFSICLLSSGIFMSVMGVQGVYISTIMTGFTIFVTYFLMDRKYE